MSSEPGETEREASLIPHDKTINDLVNLDCVNIEESIGFDYGEKFTEKNNLLINEFDEEVPEIANFCKELFDNCARTDNVDNSSVSSSASSDSSSNPESYVLFDDVISYFREHIINNKLMMESNDNEEFIQILREMFCEHFGITISNCDELSDYRLDYESMSRIIQEWIKRITLNQSIRHEASMSFVKEESFHDFNEAEFKILDAKFRCNSRLRSSNIYRSHLRFDAEEEFTSSLTSSSKPSLCNSDDDNILYSNSEYSGYNQEYYEKRLNLMSAKNYELEAEIVQLKQNISDLRSQSRNAEDLNNQMANEIEHKTVLNTELKQRHQELSNKYSSSLDENEQFQKMIVALKAHLETLQKENEYIREDMKYYQIELKKAESEITNLNIKIMDYDNIAAELQHEKKLNIESQKDSYNFEENIKEIKYQLNQKDQLISQLNQSIKDDKYIIGCLKENIKNLDQRLTCANTKLMDAYGRKECLKEQTRAKREIARSTDNLSSYHNDNVQENGHEDETVSNACLLSEFNENSFSLSFNDKDFRYEQFEQTVKTINAEKLISEEDKLMEYFKGLFILTDELKLKYNVLSKSKENDNNNNNSETIMSFNDSFNKVMETFLDYNLKNQPTKKQEMLENLITQNKSLIKTNQTLSENISLINNKLKCSKNQLLAVVTFIYKFISLKLKPFQRMYNSGSDIVSLTSDRIYHGTSTNDLSNISTKSKRSSGKDRVMRFFAKLFFGHSNKYNENIELDVQRGPILV